MNTTRSSLLRRFRQAVVSPAPRKPVSQLTDHSARAALVRVFV